MGLSFSWLTPPGARLLLYAAPVVLCSILSQLCWGWMEGGHCHCYCALGIHVDESGSPEERQSGDGTSFPESPDLSHVGTAAAFQHLANQSTVNLMLFALCLLSDHIILKVCSHVMQLKLWP